MNKALSPPCPSGPARPSSHVIHGVLQVEDAILDGVADVVLRVHHGRRHLFIGTALSQLLVLWGTGHDVASQAQAQSPTSSPRPGPTAGAEEWGPQSPTLMRIFLLSWLGEGSPSAAMSTGLVRSVSPSTFLKYWAMFLCWAMLQWSSMDKMTGYLQGGGPVRNTDPAIPRSHGSDPHRVRC